MRILVADTETSGLSSSDGICELAFTEINPDLEVMASFRSLVDPECPISPSAMGVHGITEAAVADAPTMSELMEEILVPRFGKFEDILLCAHNCQFDYRFLRNYWDITGQLCTLKLARKVYPGAPDHKLATLKHYLGLEVETTIADAHTAAGDVADLFALLKRLVVDADMDLYDLIGYSIRPEPVTHMPFGKHKGTPIAELPQSYRDWLLSEGVNISDELRWSLTKL